MSARKWPLIPVESHAMTVTAQVVVTLTGSPKLKERAHCGVYKDDGKTLCLYRKSSSAPGMLSCDIYRLENGVPVFHRKSKKKYAPPASLFPPGARVIDVDGVLCGAMTDITQEQQEALRSLLRRRPI